VLRRAGGPELKAWFPGNAPIGHTRHEGDPKGRQTFFFHVYYTGGDMSIELDPSIEDYAWITKDDMPNYISDPDTLDLIQDMLFVTQDPKQVPTGDSVEGWCR